MSNYYEWKEFEHTYLEDSYVLNINESNHKIIFYIEIVLTENHPLYTVPNKDEKYCYKNGKIVFENIKNIEWLNKNNKPSIDAAGEEDYGNIDCFEIIEGIYHIAGGWGELKLKSAPAKLEWE